MKRPVSNGDGVARIATASGAILFDRDRFAQATRDALDPHHWPQARSGATSGGRGAVWVVRGEFGEGVIRHYRRGGLVGRVNRDLYLWSGEDDTRSFREFRLLHELARRRLRVPTPLAAGYSRVGPFYRADLMTALVPNAGTLAQRVQQQLPHPQVWQGIGATLAQFHAEGVYHADLNAHNVLLDAQDRTWLIDFDRGELRTPAKRWTRANLRRLERSLHKLGAAHGAQWALSWNALLSGYEQRFATMPMSGAA